MRHKAGKKVRYFLIADIARTKYQVSLNKEIVEYLSSRLTRRNGVFISATRGRQSFLLKAQKFNQIKEAHCIQAQSWKTRYVCVYVYVCMYVCMYMYVYMYMYMCICMCNCNFARKNLKKINHIKDPITFQQMTSKIGCSFLCKNNQKNFKSSIKSKKASHTKKIQAEKKLCFLVQLLSESNCKAQSNQGSRKPPSTRPSRESFFSVTIVRKRLKT